MILLCGIPSEPPLAMVAAAASGVADSVTLNQRDVLHSDLTLRLDNNGLSGWLGIGAEAWPLDAFTGIYVRLMDHRALPEIRNEPVDSPARLHADRFHDALYEWLEMTSARVVNRLSSMASNGSKPYQAGLVQRFGFDTPETLVTSDPAQVGAFQRRFGDVVYKSISGVRSIVTTLKEDDVRLDRVRWCPVQFQERVAGTDVRVHVVGDEVFATRVRSTATDYRYAGEQVGAMAVLEPLDLSAEVAARCVDMTAAMGLAFSGIDLRFAEDGRVICFEVNPSPGFSYFEANTGQPIASAVAAYLAGGADARSIGAFPGWYGEAAR